MTKKRMVEDFPRVARDRDLFMIALNDQLNGEVCWSTWYRDPDSEGGKFRVGAGRLEAPDGGYIMVVFRYPRQKDYVTVYPADGFSSGWSNSAVQQAHYEVSTNYRENSHCTPAA